MRRRAFTWWQAVLTVMGLTIIALVLFPVFGRARNSRKPYCQSYLKMIALGIKQYVQDYDEKYPLVNSGQDGWADILQPYLLSTRIFQCPADSAEDVNGTTDYFYNARLSGESEAKIDFISSTILIGDGIDNAPTNFNLTKFSANWAKDANSPALRHLGYVGTNWERQSQGANYAYSDGHVKWLQPKSVTNKLPSSNMTTFAPW